MNDEKWYQDKNFWTNLLTFVTLLLAIWRGENQATKVAEKAEVAAVQSASNGEEIKAVRTEQKQAARKLSLPVKGE